MKCKCCGKHFKNNILRYVIHNNKDLCRHCLMLSRKEFDRKGKYSRKDKYRDKQEKERNL